MATPELRQLVQELAAIGTPHVTIAEKLGISEDTLARHFSHELATGREHVNAELGQSLVQMARGGDKQMLIFYLRTNGGWSERTGYVDSRGLPIDPPSSQTYCLNIIYDADDKPAGQEITGRVDD